MADKDGGGVWNTGDNPDNSSRYVGESRAEEEDGWPASASRDVPVERREGDETGSGEDSETGSGEEVSEIERDALYPVGNRSSAEDEMWPTGEDDLWNMEGVDTRNVGNEDDGLWPTGSGEESQDGGADALAGPNWWDSSDHVVWGNGDDEGDDDGEGEGDGREI